MLTSAIREVAASDNPALIAAAFFETTIQIWDLTSHECVNYFPTVFCAGAKNLVLASHGGLLVAGNSMHHGNVAAYEVPSGKKLWEQSVVYPSSLRFHPSGEFILCTSHARSLLKLDVRNGTILDATHGIRLNFEGNFGDLLSVPSKDGKNSTPLRLTARGQHFSLERIGFTVLDAVFSPQSVLLSEAGGPVRCISCVDGKRQWTFNPEVGSPVIRLHYSPQLDVFFGIFRNLNNPARRHLVRFEPLTGTSERVGEFESWEQSFVNASDQLVTASGEIIDLATGAITDRLSFPLREYHPAKGERDEG